MFKRNYYCLVAGLPDIMIEGSKILEDSLTFKKELLDELHPSDYDLAKLLYLKYDNKNLLNTLLKQNQEYLPLANYSLEYLEDQIKEPINIHNYLKQFIQIFNNESFDKSLMNSENKLLSLYYENMMQVKNSFLKQWFSFELNMRNIITAVNCRKFGFDIEKQLIPASNKNEVFNVLLKGMPKAEVLADEVPYAEKILKIAESELSITKKEKAYDSIKWEFLDENTSFHYFSIEKILSFIIKLNIIERWQKLDNKTGKILFERLINEIKTNYKFTEEFSVKNKIPTL